MDDFCEKKTVKFMRLISYALYTLCLMIDILGVRFLDGNR